MRSWAQQPECCLCDDSVQHNDSINCAISRKSTKGEIQWVERTEAHSNLPTEQNNFRKRQRVVAKSGKISRHA